MRVGGLASLAVLTLLGGSAWAQQDDQSSKGTFALVAGEFVPEQQLRLNSGAPVVGMRFGRPLSRTFVAEAGLSYALDDGARAPNDPLGIVAADLGIQARLLSGRYRPYLGAALSTLRASASDSDRLVPGFAAAVGASIGAAPDIEVLGEIRMRTPFRDHAVRGTEQTIGVAWRI